MCAYTLKSDNPRRSVRSASLELNKSDLKKPSVEDELKMRRESLMANKPIKNKARLIKADEGTDLRTLLRKTSLHHVRPSFIGVGLGCLSMLSMLVNGY